MASFLFVSFDDLLTGVTRNTIARTPQMSMTVTVLSARSAVAMSPARGAVSPPSGCVIERRTVMVVRMKQAVLHVLPISTSVWTLDVCMQTDCVMERGTVRMEVMKQIVVSNQHNRGACGPVDQKVWGAILSVAMCRRVT